VRKQVAAGQRMAQPKLGSQSLDGLASTCSFFNLDDPVVVCVALESRVSIRADLVLEVHIRDGRANVMRVQTLLCSDVLKSNSLPITNKGEGLGSPVKVRLSIKGAVYNTPIIIRVNMRIECDLLLYYMD
jgi:hypothetical protein